MKIKGKAVAYVDKGYDVAFCKTFIFHLVSPRISFSQCQKEPYFGIEFSACSIKLKLWCWCISNKKCMNWKKIVKIGICYHSTKLIYSTMLKIIYIFTFLFSAESSPFLSAMKQLPRENSKIVQNRKLFWQ